jgi:uncharacterized protein (TIGR02246 family)
MADPLIPRQLLQFSKFTGARRSADGSFPMLRFAAAVLCATLVAQVTQAQQPATPTAPAATPAAQPAAQPAVQPAPPADDTAAVQESLAAYVDAFNRHDVEALVALWTPGGAYVNKETGERTAGREALAADFTKVFTASPEIFLSGGADEVRVIGGDTAIVDGVTTVVQPDAEPSISAYTAIFVKQEGKWLLDTVHESDLPSPETPRQALKPLEWMVGSWQDESDSANVSSIMRWSPSQAFLIRSYDVIRDDEEPFQGSQIIGWDPAVKQIRSWTFNSDGSFGGRRQACLRHAGDYSDRREHDYCADDRQRGRRRSGADDRTSDDEARGGDS